MYLLTIVSTVSNFYLSCHMGILITLVLCVSSAHLPHVDYWSEWQSLVIMCLSNKFLDSIKSYIETLEYLTSVLYKIGSLSFVKIYFVVHRSKY